MEQGTSAGDGHARMPNNVHFQDEEVKLEKCRRVGVLAQGVKDEWRAKRVSTRREVDTEERSKPNEIWWARTLAQRND